MKTGITVAATSSGGVSTSVIVAVVFVILKLTGTIAWSWWWVLSPLLIAAGMSILFVMAFAAIAAFIVVTDT